jgi:hypothetical protein
MRAPYGAGCTGEHQYSVQPLRCAAVVRSGPLNRATHAATWGQPHEQQSELRKHLILAFASAAEFLARAGTTHRSLQRIMGLSPPLPSGVPG